MDANKLMENLQNRIAERISEIAIQKAEYEKETARLQMEKAQVELEQAKEIKERMLASIDMQMKNGNGITS